ncbi:MAG: AmmeMemoRadiSam system protein B [Candidatus Omnitrophota bacterium]
MYRKSAVAGQFYPKTKDQLYQSIKKYTDAGAKKEDALAVIMPHAGYSYSGSVAGKTVSHVLVKETALIIGPNHTGLGVPYSIVASGIWQTPLGEVPINNELATLLLKKSEFVKENEGAHVYEHSIEVEIPFLQFFNSKLSILPMVISDFNIKHYAAVGQAIAEAIIEYKQPVLIVASTDFTHYESQESVKNKDEFALNAILQLDAEKLIREVSEKHISMCGFAPVAVTIFASKRLGATQAELINYKTSGDISGDYDNVVGYAGIAIKR